MVKRAVIIASGGPRWGRGHQVRCGVLAEKLVEKGYDAHVRCMDEMLPDNLCENADLIVDAYEQVSTYSAMRSYFKPLSLTAITDVPQDVTGADLVIAPSAAGGSIDLPFTVEGDTKKVLLARGLRYAMIRPALLKAKDIAPRERFRNITDLRTINGLAPSTIGSMLATSKLAIAPGGMRALESIALGCPTLIAYDNGSVGEMLNARALAASGLAEPYDPRLGSVDSHAEVLLGNEVRLGELASRCRGAIDGRGAERAANAIASLRNPMSMRWLWSGD